MRIEHIVEVLAVVRTDRVGLDLDLADDLVLRVNIDGGLVAEGVQQLQVHYDVVSQSCAEDIQPEHRHSRGSNAAAQDRTSHGRRDRVRSRARRVKGPAVSVMDSDGHSCPF